MTGDMLTAIVLAIAAFLSWILQGETELAFGAAFVIMLAYGLPAFARKDTDNPASPVERWVIIGLGVVCIGAAAYQAFA